MAFLVCFPSLCLEAGKHAHKHKKEARVHGLDYEKEAKPHLLPKSHPIYGTLSEIFSKTNDPLTKTTIQPLGFEILDKLGLHVIVAKHRQMKGYVFKFFKYHEFPGVDWQHWIKRINGAKLIQEGINKLGYQKIFKVARKWLFKTKSMQSKDGKNYPAYILIAEDVKPKPVKKNQHAWRYQTSEITLDALHTMLRFYGLRDCARIHNVPYCEDGKIAFVDTESYQSWPVNYHPLIEFLNKTNRKIWKHLVKMDDENISPRLRRSISLDKRSVSVSQNY